MSAKETTDTEYSYPSIFHIKGLYERALVNSSDELCPEYLELFKIAYEATDLLSDLAERLPRPIKPIAEKLTRFPIRPVHGKDGTTTPRCRDPHGIEGGRTRVRLEWVPCLARRERDEDERS